MGVKEESVNWYRKKLKAEPNLENPVSYNDKIQWLKINDQDPDHVICCDKIQVKDYVAKIVGPEIIIPNTTGYPAVWKANHGSGGIQFVNSKEDEAVALANLQPILKKTYGKNKGEWAYRLITPGIVKERRIDNNDVDYKFHCCNGEVKWLQMIWDRYSGKTKESNIDPNGKPMTWWFDEKMQHVEVGPHCGLEKFFELKKIAEKLSERWKYVRVDLYYGEGKPWFGELTFWPKAGCYKTPDQVEFGKLLDFDMTTTKPKVVD